MALASGGKQWRKSLPALLDVDIYCVAQETRYYLDMDDVQKQVWAHWENTGEPDFKKGVVQTFMGSFKKKYGQVRHRKNGKTKESPINDKRRTLQKAGS